MIGGRRAHRTERGTVRVGPTSTRPLTWRGLFWSFFFGWALVGSILLAHGPLPPLLAWSSPFFLYLCALAGALLLAYPFGDRQALWLALALGTGGYVVECVGVQTGWPFGRYYYTGALGPELLRVPLAMVGAWILTSALAHQFTRRLATSPRRVPIAVVCAALLCTSLDALLDPVAVHVQRDWIWQQSGPYYGIPTSNFVAWTLVSLLFQALLVLWPSNRSRATRSAGADRIAWRLTEGAWLALILLFGGAAIRVGWWPALAVGVCPWLLVGIAGALFDPQRAQDRKEALT